MPAETVSDTDTGRGRAETIHVALLDEGLGVWRPVAARRSQPAPASRRPESPHLMGVSCEPG